MTSALETTPQSTLQTVLDEMQAHIEALRELNANQDRELIIDHLYKLAAEAHGTADVLKHHQAAAHERSLDQENL